MAPIFFVLGFQQTTIIKLCFFSIFAYFLEKCQLSLISFQQINRFDGTDSIRTGQFSVIFAQNAICGVAAPSILGSKNRICRASLSG